MLDIYATSIDYDPSAEASKRFFAAVQNKMHWAAHGHTAAEVGTGKPKEEEAPLSEIIQVLNDRYGTRFTEEDRLFFAQIKEKACNDEQVIQTALANPLDKFSLGVKKLIADLMLERMAENDAIVTRYMDDQQFQGTAYPILAKEIFDSVHTGARRARV